MKFGFKNTKRLSEMLRVNHSGELGNHPFNKGADAIYKGQILAMKIKGIDYKEIEHMWHQEVKHLEFFNNELIKNKIRPSFLRPIWKGLGINCDVRIYCWVCICYIR